jgi:hypothetical protein
VGTSPKDSKGSIPEAAYLPMGINIGRTYSGGCLRSSGGTGVSSSESPPRVTFFLSLFLLRRGRRCCCGVRS